MREGAKGGDGKRNYDREWRKMLFWREARDGKRGETKRFGFRKNCEG